MKKITLILFFVVVCSALFADFTIEQSLIDTLTNNAIKNLEPLPENLKKVYNQYLAEYSDGIMSFMISSEDNSKLWDTKPEFLLDNYKIVKKLMEMEDFDKFSDKFVLSYIIKTTVSHEKLTNYRKIFAEKNLLEYVNKFPNLTDRIREINLWCRENMMFVSTSGRTQDPLSVLQKSNIGRCGEMQVFFISACRTIGIPARPAWTPWWAHTDNNHAWTEVFVDGNWHYVENAQPDYFLDSTWFSASVTKALLVLARSSFPDSLDDVVVKGKNNNYVNSTSYYQETRDVKFNILDSEKNPVDSVAINFFAFNFSLLRPLLGIRTDSLGIASVNISKGTFLAIAYKDSLYDFALIPFGKESSEYTLILEDKKWEDLDFIFEYPKATGIRKDDPDFFAERKKKAEEKYNDLVKEIQSHKIPNYAPQNDSLFEEVFKKCRNNKQSVLKFIKENDNIEKDFWTKILNIDPKFLWQATTAQWNNIYSTYLDLKNKNINEEIFSDLLSPSVKYEILPNIQVPKKYIIDEAENPKDKIHKIIKLLHSNHEVDKKKATSGLMSLDILIEASYLQDFQFKTLSCYVLKANYIPAQYTRIPSTIMVKADSVWQNYDVIKNEFSTSQDTSNSTLTAIDFKLIDDSGLPVTINPDNISTTIFKNGRFYPNDRQLDYNKEKSEILGKLEKGSYQVQIGIRESGNITKVKLISLNLNNQLHYSKDLIFKDFRRNWKKIDNKYLEFVSSFLDNQHEDCIILIGNYDNEPIQRLATKTRNKKENQKFIWIGNNKPIEPISNYIVSDKYKTFLENNPELKHRLISFYYDSENEKWNMFEGNWDILFK